MKDSHSPYSIRCEVFPDVPRPAKPVILHLFVKFSISMYFYVHLYTYFACGGSSNGLLVL